LSEDQAELFGEAAAGPPVYVPKPEHVRNSLQSLLGKMQAAKTWPWSPATVRLHRERTFAYLCERLPDRDEAERWRTQIEVEVARLDAAESAAA
jgi:hypothetical protein